MMGLNITVNITPFRPTYVTHHAHWAPTDMSEKKKNITEQ